ncbi:adenylate kinase 7-like isoform X2 [Gouania willdenowi]|uniref:adenylate kinase 7-like isoform X2 n=1 Tax=Gouania willdenowi TaxID=441366 RepID=UPI0010557EF9|nr:adenylate kinase 7-like isoform X2 [Gouania willdenowi]
MGENSEETGQKRVFINNVDGYSSKYIAEFLSTCTPREPSDDGEAEEPLDCPEDGAAFQVLGTVSAPCKQQKCAFFQTPTREELFRRLLECDVVIYNISEKVSPEQIDEATWALSALQAEMGTFKSQKIFILVSTVMTWALTKPQNPEATDGLLTEEEFRRRRPHSDFKNHHSLEKLVLKLARGKKSKLCGYVVAAGLQYGMGENLLHFFFKASWLMQFPKLPIFGDGLNHIPMIHVLDLGGVIQNIIELLPKSKYILAVDNCKSTLKDVVQKISNLLGPEQVDTLPEQEAIAMKAFKPEELEYLKVDLRLDAFIIMDSFIINWRCESGIVENMESIVEEYKTHRQLLSVKICLVGPPAVGKTTVAEKICRHYQIHHIKIKEMIEEKIKQLKEVVNKAEPDPEYGSEEKVTAAQKKLNDIVASMEANEGQLDTHLIIEVLQEKLKSKQCINQGFVLDGFPETYEEAKNIFSSVCEQNQDTDLMLKSPAFNKKITPEFIFVLEAADDVLVKRVQGLPESEAEKKHYTQDEFTSRLMRYRQLCNAEDTLLNYFDELEILLEPMEVSADDPEYTGVMKTITEIIGAPKNYGRSPEEQEEEDRRKEAEMKQKPAAEAAERKRKNEAALAVMTAQYEEWENLTEVRRQEEELLKIQSLPLRNYLMKYVMPKITEAMVDCSKNKPEDPVDFLAEHLLHNIPRE